MSSFEQMLGKSMEDAKEPERLPAGQWVLRCQGAKATAAEEGSDSAGRIQFTHVPVRAGENVDTEAVESGEWRGKRIFTTVFVRDEGDLFQARQIIEAHGIAIEGGRDFKAGLDLVKGRAVEATVGLRTFKRRDGSTSIENQLSNFKPASA